MPLDALLSNLLSPIVLAFVLGVVASLVKSDLRIPEALYSTLTLYLLLAIGLKGGVALRETTLAAVGGPALATFVLSLLTPVLAFGVLTRLLRFDRANAAALAAHYGSVSAVTFIAALSFATLLGLPAEGFMPALVALLEVPAIVVGLLFAAGRHSASWRTALHEVLVGRSIVLLVGGLLIGVVVGPEGFAPVKPFFVVGFPGALTLFLLEMGIVTAARLHDLRRVGARLIGFAIGMPIVHGLLGVALGQAAGLSVGGSGVLGAMAASASYIAAPAAVRIALPDASPTLYLTAALGITFPFNLTLGLPLYFGFAQWLAS